MEGKAVFACRRACYEARPNLSQAGVTIRFPTDLDRQDSSRRGKKGDRIITIEVDPDRVAAQSSESSNGQPDGEKTDFSAAFPACQADGSKSPTAGPSAESSADGRQKTTLNNGLFGMTDGSDGSDGLAADFAAEDLESLE